AELARRLGQPELGFLLVGQRLPEFEAIGAELTGRDGLVIEHEAEFFSRLGLATDGSLKPLGGLGEILPVLRDQVGADLNKLLRLIPREAVLFGQVADQDRRLLYLSVRAANLVGKALGEGRHLRRARP